MSTIKNLISAARLRTLPLALSCIIVGSAIAYYFESFQYIIFILAIITTVLLQVLSNFANDLGDSEKGVDNEHRVGPMRAVQSGAISPLEMKKWIKITILLALVSGVLLLLVSNLFWIQKLVLLFIGFGAIWSANYYTRGTTSYGYKGWGDVFVFLFFGLIGVMGTLFLYIHYINSASILPAIGVGLLSSGVLHLNNMRDMVNDRASNKMTLAIKLGFENARLYFLFIIVIAIVSWGSFVFTQNKINYFSFIYWIGFLPLIAILIRFFKVKELIDFDKLLKPLALTTFIISILFFISQIF